MKNRKNHILTGFHKLNQYHCKLQTDYQDVQYKYESLINDLYESHSQENAMIKADEITIKAYKSKIKELKRKIEELFEEKAETNELLETSQKNFESLNIEYEGAKKD
jgi:hypothetical protein